MRHLALQTRLQQLAAASASAYARLSARSGFVRSVARQFPRRRARAAIRAGLRAGRSGQYAAAERHYRRALARSPGLTAIWVQLGHMLKGQGDFGGAEAAYHRSLALDGSIGDTHLQLGHLLKLQSRWEEAGDAYARALQLDPGLQHAKDELAALCPRLVAEGDKARDARQWQLAARYYRWVLDRQPELGAVWVQLGHVLKEHGEFAAAEAAYSALALASPEADLVSVIITCYNFEQYLRECVESVIAQTYLNLEIIIIDDGSSDNSNEVVADLRRQYLGRIQYYRNEHSGQPAVPRNFGVAKASGKFIICLDGDDKLHPEYIEACARVLQENPSASIAYTEIQTFGGHDQIWNCRDYNFQDLLFTDFIPSGSMYKKIVWQEVGGYKTNLRGADDWNFWIEAGKFGHFGVPVKRILFYHRIRADNMFDTVVVPNMEAKWNQIILNNSDVYDIELVKKAALFQLGGGDTGNGGPTEMNHVAFLALMKQIFNPRTYIEVGVWQGATLLSDPVPDFVVGIDPDPALTADVMRGCRNLLIMRSTSDDAFAELSSAKILGKRQSDFAFVDGMHHCEVVLRDIANCARLSREGALIFVHDVLPSNQQQASREPVPGAWMGDVYKVVPTIWRFFSWIPTLLINDIPPSGMLILRVTGDMHAAIFGQYDALVTAMAGVELEPTLEEMGGKAVSRTSPALAGFIEQALHPTAPQ